MFEPYLIFLIIIFGISVILFINSKFSKRKSLNEILKKNDWYGNSETEIFKINNSSPYRQEAPELLNKVYNPTVIGNPGIPHYKSNDLLILGFLVLILLSKGK